MGTGHHAALSGGVTHGSTVAVVGDGAVGLCAVLASKRLWGVPHRRDVAPRRPAGHRLRIRGDGCRRGARRGAASSTSATCSTASVPTSCSSASNRRVDGPGHPVGAPGRHGRLRRVPNGGAEFAHPHPVQPQRRGQRRRRARAQLYPRAAAGGARPPHQPGPRLRPDPAARRGRRGPTSRWTSVAPRRFSSAPSPLPKVPICHENTPKVPALW
ncbi:MAG: hypothetical protein WDM88_07155 [Galbitalea sp.]